MNSSKENLKNSSKENLNLTNDSHSSMEMTRCLNKDIIHDVQFNRAKTEKTEVSLHCSFYDKFHYFLGQFSFLSSSPLYPHQIHLWN